MKKLVLGAILAAFAGLTVAAVARHGYFGIFAYQFHNLAGLQVLADLGVALLLVVVWLWKDARVHGRNPYPWLLVTLLGGSFGPLLYWLLRAEASDRTSIAESGNVRGA